MKFESDDKIANLELVAKLKEYVDFQQYIKDISARIHLI